MNIVLWLLAGGLVALLARFQDAGLQRQKLLMDVCCGAPGAAIGGLLASPATQWLSLDVHWPGMAAALVAAAVLLVIVNLHSLRDRR